ncbi:uncharacterized protein LOC131307018 [Rhododendron vialii]|uniref:uncharacterized protein LOC131307018 n=1 Tax=Rhododendron vialii TaxID=182163 RepID=UPI00265FB26A|nr:uncharacterized protein LOC131307018 [Rhododendron vialii]
MDREQKDMQFLGRFGIYLESCKIIFNFRRILSKISLAFILPLSLIFLANIAVSDSLSSQGAAFWLVEFVYLTFFLVFSILSTSAVVYTVASVYTGSDVTFGKVMSVIPKVWKRLMVTFLCAFLAIFLCNVVLVVLIILWRVTIKHVDRDALVFFRAFVILYVVVIVYMTVVWWLAGVISVLEDIKGIQAMTKSRNLIQGKMRIAIVFLLKLGAAIYGIWILFESQVVRNASSGVPCRLAFGFLCLLMLFSVLLFGLVTETVIYFVCKSYHHEYINKLSLSDHLDEVNQGEYIPTKANDVQLEKIDG